MNEKKRQGKYIHMFALKWKERKKKSKIYLTGVDGGGGKWRRCLPRPGRGGGGGRRGEEYTRRRRGPKWLLCTSPRLCLIYMDDNF